MYRLVILSACIAYVSASTLPYWKGDQENILKVGGGSRVGIRDRPFQVDLEGFCGGSIIGPKWILTAAHCNHSTSWSVRVGSDKKKHGTSYKIKNKISHENYKLHRMMINDEMNSIAVNDIMLIELEQELIFSSKVNLIELDDGTESLAGRQGVVSGYGDTDNTYNNNVLLKANVGILDDISCRKNVRKSAEIFGLHFAVLDNTVICAGAINSNFCEGDSGGPLTVGDKLVGVVSFGPGRCPNGVWPGKYVKVSAMRNWIRGITGI